MRAKNILKLVSQHSVARNAFALAVMQFANFVVPLLLLPFLTRKLGIEAFGLVAITLAAIQFAFVLTDYGFTLSATYAISINRCNAEFINKKIGSIFGAKILLVSLVAIAFLAIPHVSPEFTIYTHFCLGALIATVAQAFQPIWLFQGLERMKKITIYTVTTKIIYAALVLQMISKPEDAVFVIYCWSIAQTVGLLASLYFIRAEGYKITCPSIVSIKQEFKEGAQFFLSRLSVSLYTSLSTLIVGSQSTIQVALFAVCEQIYKAAQNVTSPINSAMFPYMAKNRDWKVFYKILLVTISVITVGCFVLSVFAGSILGLLFGEEYSAAAPVLLVFLCTTVVNYLGVTFGYSAFSALGRVQVANITVIAGAFVHVLTLAIMYLYFDVSAFSVALAVLVTELFVMIVRVICFFYIKSI